MNQITYESLESITNSKYVNGARNIFLITGRTSFKKSEAQTRLKDISRFGAAEHFYDFSPNPKFEDVVKGVEQYRNSRSDLIVAIGGGSVIDMAKLIKGLASVEDPKAQILGRETVAITNTPIIAVPTTAGSGGESTHFAVVYIDGIKHSFEHPGILPEEIVLDSSLTHSLMPRQTAVSGMDALSHAIESYWSVNSTVKSRSYSEKAIKMILENLKDAVNIPNKKIRYEMLQAANLAGRAIAIAKTTAAHSISYPITSRFNIPHGHAVALTLGEVLEYNAGVEESDCTDKRGIGYVRSAMSYLLRLMEVRDACAAKNKINQLMLNLGLETRLSRLGIREIDIIIREGFNERRMGNNPRRITENKLNYILGNIK